MPDPPTEDTTVYAQSWADDTRDPLPRTGDERTMLTAMPDWHRETFALKCAGVPPERLSEKAVPPSGLSLHGPLRHLAASERWWFRQQFLGEDVADLYYTDGDPAEAFAVWRAECARSRQIVAAADLDDTGIQRSTGQPIAVRRIMLHMIAEYARHNGHADLLRERIDGATGH